MANRVRVSMGRGGKVLARAGQWLRPDDGTIMPLTLSLLVLMLMMGGIAVDIMHAEGRRSRLQATADRCALNAAIADPDVSPDDAVRDCIDRAGLAYGDLRVATIDTLSKRQVSVQMTDPVQTFFMRMMGTDRLDMQSATTAEQDVDNVEIALVLDVSGSMAGQKLASLKSAAQGFVDQVLTQDPERRISIALVPYNGQVNLGPDLAGTLAIQGGGAAQPPNLNCVDLPPDAYSTTDLPGTTATALPRTGHVDSYSTTWQWGYARPTSTAYATPVWSNEWCPVGDGLSPTNTAASTADLAGAANILRLPSRDCAAIKAQIANLVAIGATSINAGLRWGIGLLDPSAQGVFADLIARGRMSDALADHPLPYDTPSLAKVVVLMTDGEHFPEERLNPDYRDGPSPIYLSRDGEFSIFHSSRSQTAKYWVPATGTWQTTPYRGSSAQAPQQLTWPEVWARLRMSYVAYQFYARPLGRSVASQMNLFRSQTDAPTMDSQLLSACTLAKTKGVVIYTVAFDAPSHGTALLQSCATSAGFAYTAGQGDLAQVFAGIAANIRQLRLTQ